MTRLMLMLVCSMALVGCNLSDPLDGPPGAANNENNENNENNDDPDMDTDDMGGGDLDVTFSEVRINAEQVPTQAQANMDLMFEADATITGATGNVQLVIYIDDSEPSCLFDGDPTGEVDVEGMIAGSTEVETKELMFEAFQEADCDAALAATTGDGEVIGEVEFLEPPQLEVSEVDPAADATGVAVDSTITVTFNQSIDAGSVTGLVTLEDGMTEVPTTVNVMGDQIILTPSSDLAEFQTLYTVTVSPGITAGGSELQDEFTSTFRTVMFVTNVRYVATNESHGMSFNLGINTANECQVMPGDNTAPEQRFRFLLREGAWVGQNDAPFTASRALDAGDGQMVPCGMRVFDNNDIAAEQLWTFVPNPAGPRLFLMQSARLDEVLSLDATDESPSVGAFPLMQPTDAMRPQQQWRWRRVN